MRILNWPFTSNKHQSVVSVNAHVHMCVLRYLYAVDRQINLFWGSRFVQYIDGSSHLSCGWHSPGLCARIVSVPDRETSRARVNCEECFTVCVYVWRPPLSLPAPPEGSRADDIAQAAEQLNQRWVGFCALLADRLAWLAYQAKVHMHTSQSLLPEYNSYTQWFSCITRFTSV